MKIARFNTEKAIQTAVVLLGRESTRSMTRLRLMKLFYMANRRMIQLYGRPIVDGCSVAMKHGPVPSEVYALVTGGHSDEPQWTRHFRNIGRNLRLAKEVAPLDLSQAEIDVLNAVSDEMAPFSDWDVAEFTHTYGEWVKNYPDPTANTSHPIPLSDIVEAVGLGEFAERIAQDLQDQKDFSRLFAP